MSNHPNRGWRKRWMCDALTRTAVHESGVIARAEPSPTNPANDRVTLTNTDKIDRQQWDMGRLTEQAMTLWLEGELG